MIILGLGLAGVTGAVAVGTRRRASSKSK